MFYKHPVSLSKMYKFQMEIKTKGIAQHHLIICEWSLILH